MSRAEIQSHLEKIGKPKKLKKQLSTSITLFWWQYTRIHQMMHQRKSEIKLLFLIKQRKQTSLFIGYLRCFVLHEWGKKITLQSVVEFSWETHLYKLLSKAEKYQKIKYTGSNFHKIWIFVARKSKISEFTYGKDKSLRYQIDLVSLQNDFWINSHIYLVLDIWQ
jgi:hypothetical protein